MVDRLLADRLVDRLLEGILFVFLLPEPFFLERWLRCDLGAEPLAQ